MQRKQADAAIRAYLESQGRDGLEPGDDLAIIRAYANKLTFADIPYIHEQAWGFSNPPDWYFMGHHFGHVVAGLSGMNDYQGRWESEAASFKVSTDLSIQIGLPEFKSVYEREPMRVPNSDELCFDLFIDSSALLIAEHTKESPLDVKRRLEFDSGRIIQELKTLGFIQENGHSSLKVGDWVVRTPDGREFSASPGNLDLEKVPAGARLPNMNNLQAELNNLAAVSEALHGAVYRHPTITKLKDADKRTNAFWNLPVTVLTDICDPKPVYSLEIQQNPRKSILSHIFRR